MCAAPGGKTTAIGQLMGDSGLIIALERSGSKVYPHPFEDSYTLLRVVVPCAVAGCVSIERLEYLPTMMTTTVPARPWVAALLMKFIRIYLGL